MISIIAAIDQERGIGKDNQLLWHLPDDLKHFKDLTWGHPIIMGRKTHESIGRALPDRMNIVITRDERYLATGCVICHTLEGAITYAKLDNPKEIFVIGGGKVYQQAIDIADTLYLTLVQGTYQADTFFPEYHDHFTQVSQEEHASGNYRYSFTVWRRHI